jgi:hypothetical protein
MGLQSPDMGSPKGPPVTEIKTTGEKNPGGGPMDGINGRREPNPAPSRDLGIQQDQGSSVEQARVEANIDDTGKPPVGAEVVGDATVIPSTEATGGKLGPAGPGPEVEAAAKSAVNEDDRGDRVHHGAPVFLRSREESASLEAAHAAAAGIAANNVLENQAPAVPTENMSSDEMRRKINNGEIPDPASGHVPKQIEGDANFQDRLAEARINLGENASERSVTSSALEAFYINQIKGQRRGTTNSETRTMLKDKRFREMWNNIDQRIKAEGGESIDRAGERLKVYAKWKYMHDTMTDLGLEDPKQSLKDKLKLILLSFLVGAVTSTNDQVQKAARGR